MRTINVSIHGIAMIPDSDFAGHASDHLATELAIALPPEQDDPTFTYRLYLTTSQSSYGTAFITEPPLVPAAGILSFALPSGVMVRGPLRVQLRVEDATGVVIHASIMEMRVGESLGTVGSEDIPARYTGLLEQLILDATAAITDLLQRASSGAFDGPPGPAGPPGQGFSPLGTAETLQQLEQYVPNPNIGDVYAVGTVPPYDIYVWTMTPDGPAWINLGPIQGPPGQDGAPGGDGAPGATGATGPQGIQGPPGENAIAAFNPRGVFSMVQTYNKMDLVTSALGHAFTPLQDGVTGVAPPETFTPSAYWMPMVMAGAPGAQGPTGATGATGAQGPPGSAGPQGPKGDPGSSFIGDTSNLSLSNPAAESVSAAAAVQSTVNMENKGQLTALWQAENALEFKVNGVDGRVTALEAGGSAPVPGARSVQAVTVASGTANVDLSAASLAKGNIFRVTPQGATTVTAVNPAPALGTLTEFEVHIVMGPTAHAVTWGFGGMHWLDGIPALEAGRNTVLVFRTVTGSAFQGNKAYEYY